MTVKTYLFVIIAYMGCLFVVSLVDGAFSSDSNVDALLQFKVLQMADVPVLPFKVPLPNLDFFKALQDALTWNFSFFTGEMRWVRFLIFLPITAAVGFGMVVVVGPVMIQAARLFRPW